MADELSIKMVANDKFILPENVILFIKTLNGCYFHEFY
jgi:hypothetical protein